MRLNDTYLGAIAMAPKAVASATLTTTGFVDVSGVPEVTFLVATGALTKGKKLTVQLVASDVAEGTGAVQIAEQVFTAEEAITGRQLSASGCPWPVCGHQAQARRRL